MALGIIYFLFLGKPISKTIPELHSALQRINLLYKDKTDSYERKEGKKKDKVGRDEWRKRGRERERKREKR